MSITLTSDDEQWVRNYTAGLKDGTYTKADGFVMKLKKYGVSNQDVVTLLDHCDKGTPVPVIAQVVEDFLLGDKTPIEQGFINKGIE